MATSYPNGPPGPSRSLAEPPTVTMGDAAAHLVQQYGSDAVVLAIEEVYRCLDHGSRAERATAFSLLSAVEQSLTGSRGNRRARQ